MTYELIWEPNGVVKRFSAHVTSDEVGRATAAVECSPRFDGIRYVINDFLDCIDFSYCPVAVDEIAAVNGAAALANNNISIAVVATIREVIEASNHYASSDLHPYPTRVFSTLDEAREWLATQDSKGGDPPPMRWRL